MKGQLTLRLPENLIKRIEKICLKEGRRSASSFCEEAARKLVEEKEKEVEKNEQ